MSSSGLKTGEAFLWAIFRQFFLSLGKIIQHEIIH